MFTPGLQAACLRRSGRKNYRDALAGSEWENVRIELSVKGNKDKRHALMLLDKATWGADRSCSSLLPSCEEIYEECVAELRC